MIELINGDCLEKLKKIENKSIDLVYLDLPYGQTVCKWDTKIDLDKLWIQLKRIGKKNTPYFFSCNTKFGIDLINSNKKWFRYDMVWIKSISSGFLNCYKMPMKKHEMIYVFYKHLPLYNCKKYHKEFKKGNENLTDRKTVYGTLQMSSGKTHKKRLPTSILDIPNPNNKNQHKTQKPLELIKWILKYYSKENDIILDPTMGSGTTAIACLDMNRRFIGIEKDEKIFNIAKDRIGKYKNNKDDKLDIIKSFLEK